MKTENARASAPGDIKVSMTRMKAKRKKKRRIIILSASLAAFAVAIITVLVILFFKVETIEVTGNVKYNADDIAAVCGIKKGSSMLTVDKGKAEQAIKNKFPAVKNVTIKKSLPSKVTVNVTESEEVLFVAFGDHYYSLDGELRVVEMYDSIETAELLGMKRIYIPGVTTCITGEMLVTSDKDIPEMIITLYSNLVKNDLFHEISEIDFRDKFDIVFTLGVSYTVKFGNILECETKLEILDGVLEKVAKDYVGTLDLSSGNIKEVTLSRG